jgi:N-acyl amino acid synthase of PEP-CTERM/exosortase system
VLINRFVTVLANTNAARRAHHRLRYRIFCEEAGFEDPARFPDGLERDRYDDAASHFLVWDRYDERWVGAMRLIEAGRARTPSEDICPFPLQGLDANRSSSVEFSRLCVRSDSRNTPPRTWLQVDALAHASGPKPLVLRQRGNEVLLRLLYATLGWGWDTGFSYCYGIITPAMARCLTRLGIPLERIGTEVIHRGTRIPYRYHVREAMAGMTSKLPEFADMVAEGPAYISHSVFASEMSPWTLAATPHPEREPLVSASA